ncbi:hypothetical protein B0H13DRAFT_2097562, partial [Mycena leptocephala]
VVLSPLATIPSVLVVPPATSAVPVRHATTGPHLGLYFVRSKPCLPLPSRYVCCGSIFLSQMVDISLVSIFRYHFCDSADLNGSNRATGWGYWGNGWGTGSG